MNRLENVNGSPETSRLNTIIPATVRVKPAKVKRIQKTQFAAHPADDGRNGSDSIIATTVMTGSGVRMHTKTTGVMEVVLQYQSKLSSSICPDDPLGCQSICGL
ncbi:hypothetical protein PC123_g8608 [Phytophthora cactorum]|nr:hypothetical protein PC120_g15669 [Phytophthora cactorum]KAG4056348.1 hypothetical protein PC123_g8608 [Phytophthora cactorum]